MSTTPLDRALLRLERWYQHRLWHGQYPRLYWATNGNPNDPNDFICCPFCRKRYPSPALSDSSTT